MAFVVFLRAANVGGHNTFKPSQFAKAVSALEVTNIGAAGTFIVGGAGSANEVRREIRAELPIEPELMIRPASEVLSLVKRRPFGREAAPAGVKWVVTVLGKKPRALPAIPLGRPSDAKWKVRVIGLEGPYALSLYRRMDERPLYPNEVVEREFGVPATTRAWSTILAVAKRLEKT